ncbi:FAD-dependent oxidoreductase [Sphingomonas immobilis]|uniref:FAD-dependent oxidoreductase n=1 Tax=Sphingomonas immobilis TaxID=3063997 RepID=A0ABT9A6K1_9SPHN|nr:FAD-dependent oxidoreductase [Sphingomonas sp. CA1-15]MDO7844611.1 FAD-dependent oxidoreductase [Sphingomonas sp. CA1-15]
MLIDCAQPGHPERLDTDVAILGSGPAGIALALALADHGIAFVLVEAGGMDFDKAGQEFYRASLIEPESHGPVHLYRRRAFGGTSAVWGGRCIPYDPIDFEDRAWIPNAAWPIAHEEIAAYYPRALDICRAGPAAFTAAEALPDTPGGMIDDVPSADVILDRLERFSEPTHFGKAYREKLAAAPNATLLTGATATALVTENAGARCTGADLHTATGGTIALRARRTIVATGGLETPRLLLASNADRPAGLGNERDLVGRFYQAHLEGEIGTLAFHKPAKDVRLDYQRSPEGIYCRRYIWLSPEAQRREHLSGLIARPAHASIVDPAHRDPVLSAMYLVKDFILPEYARKLTSTERRVKAAFGGGTSKLIAAHIGNLVRHPFKLAGFSIDWGRRRVLATRKLPSVVLRDPRNAYPLDINAEQSPNRDSRVYLSNERDPHGVPRLSIDWRMTSDDRDRVARGMRVLQAAFATSSNATLDLHELDEQVAEITRIGGHHIGTARMAASPQDGVIDGNCETFETRDLFVAGAAAFPTSSFANPTLTIIALSLRLADHLAATATR